MATKVYTAHSGEALRAFAQTLENNPRVSVFPEAKLSPAEQANFVTDNVGKFDAIVTFSAFIISDTNSDDLCIIDFDKSIRDQSKVKFGDSINRINSIIWKTDTIGKAATEQIEHYRNCADKCTTKAEVELVINDAVNTLGDSVGKIILLKVLYDLSKSLSPMP